MEPAQNVNVLGMKALINNSGKLGISSDNEFISCEILINFYSLEWSPIVSNSRLESSVQINFAPLGVWKNSDSNVDCRYLKSTANSASTLLSAHNKQHGI